MSGSNRTEILNFRVTKEEKQQIEDKALIKYDTLAPYLRDCALQKYSLFQVYQEYKMN